MVQRSLLLVALIALLSCAAAVAQEEEDNFVRPNEAEECGEPIDFMAYAEGLENTNCGEEQCEYQEQAATLFDLKYRKDYKVIEYKSSPEVEGEIVEVDGEPTQGTAATYILYPCGLEKPNDEWIQERIEANISEILFVEIPLTAAVTDDSTIGWMLEELGVLDRVRYGPEAATSPCLQKIVDSEEDGGCGRLFNASYKAEPTNTTEFDIEFGFTASPAAKGVIFQASADPGPLARAEHIMYLSTFFNKEAVASDWYKQVSDSYGEKAAAVEAAEAPPTVAWVSHAANGSDGFQVGPDGEPLLGPVTTFSFARYKALLTRDAGGALQVQADAINTTNAFASNDDVKLAAALFPSEADYNEAVLSLLAGVDILIDENFIIDPATLDTTVDEILGQFGLNGTDVDPALYPFIGNENVWRHDKARSEDGNDEWFGEAVARPDLVHSDLQEMITPGSLENHTFMFFRNMYNGESVTSVGPESCTLSCDAWEEQEALIFSEAVSNGTEAEGTEGTDAAGTEGEEDVTEDEGSPASHSAVAAGVVIATTILASMI